MSHVPIGGECTREGAEPPAGPKKFRNDAIYMTNFENFANFRFSGASVKKTECSSSSPSNSQAMALVTHLAGINLTMVKLFRYPTNSRIERKSLLKTPVVIKKICPIGKRIAPAAELLLELRLYESSPNWNQMHP